MKIPLQFSVEEERLTRVHLCSVLVTGTLLSLSITEAASHAHLAY